MSNSVPWFDADEIFPVTETPEESLLRRSRQLHDPESRPWKLSPELEARRQELLRKQSAAWRATDRETAQQLRQNCLPKPDDAVARLALLAKRRSVLLPTEDWRSNLRLTKEGNIKSDFDNVIDVFQTKNFWQHPTIHPDSPYFNTSGGRFAYDQMTDTPCILLEPLDEDGELVLGTYKIHSLTERHEQEFSWVRYALTRVLRTKLDKFMLWDAILYLAHQREFHPVREYLRTLKWDGASRIVWLAKEVLGIESPTPIQVTMLGRWLISCVARAMKPGCQVDTVFVLCGEQGLKKSNFFRTLTDPWFSDSPINISHKDSFQQLANSWVYEWAEMGKLIRSKDRDDIKGFITSPTDTYRAPYERKPSKHPRSMVFVGTTNDLEFLNDPTGNRRFWILPVHKLIDVAKLEACRDQVWAEAVADYDHGTQWHLTVAEELERRSTSEDFQLQDAWHRPIVEYLDKAHASGKDYVTLNEVLNKLGLEQKDFSIPHQQRVRDILRGLGYRPARLGHDGKRGWRKAR